mmetsp:Transcript_29317/g.61074  ORF Transcript_29317/g.61074 Transcript_29317/m.61074 type:complete len:136 (-) Transcript_29317:328-735(-)
MNSSPLLQTLRRTLIRPHPQAIIQRNISTTQPPQLPLKPGTPIPGLSSIYPPSKDPNTPNAAPVALPREEYPDWINDLATPLPSVAKLRAKLENIDFEKVDVAAEGYEELDRDMKRYLKLTRRARIKENNASRKK